MGDHMQGQGIRFRLQGYVPDFGASVLNAFDLPVWKQATSLVAFGVELFVREGAVNVSLRHVSPDGAEQEIARLTCFDPGSAFSPPIFLADQPEGVILPVVESASEGAEYDIYFGTNEPPLTPYSATAFILDAEGQGIAGALQAFRDYRQEHRAQSTARHAQLIVIDQNNQADPAMIQDACSEPETDSETGEYKPVTLLPNDRTGAKGPGRGLYEIGYGKLAERGFTHFCLLHDAQALHPEMLARTAALHAFLQPGFYLGAPVYSSAATPTEARCHCIGQPLPDGENLAPTDLTAFLRAERIRDRAGPHWLGIDTRDMHRNGLPYPLSGRDAAREYDDRLNANGLRAILPLSLWSMPSGRVDRRTKVRRPNRPEQTTIAYWGQLAVNQPSRLWPGRAQNALRQQYETAALHLKAENGLRSQGYELAKQIHRLESQLAHNNLLDPARVQADQDRANRVMLSLLRNRHAGQRAVIVGNGPSLKIPDLDRLRGEITFASNKIYLAYGDTDWRPTYYSVEDHLVLLNNRDAIAALKDSFKIFPANMRDFGYHEADTVFAPFLPPKSFEEPLSDPDFPEFSTDLSHGICWGSTIVYSQIQMAVHMGCTEIVLIGIDHSYALPSVKQGNYYLHEGEKNHFHPEYRSPGEKWHQPNLEVLEVSYARARDICAARGINVVNASRKTALDVFERADFDKLFTSETP